ncbi:MAG: integrin alpha [Acidobacteriota bacterium]
MQTSSHSQRLKSIRIAASITAVGIVATSLAGASLEDEWLTHATAAIEESEYQFSVTAERGCSAPNRAHGFRTTLSNEQISFESRTKGADPSAGGWTLSVQLSSIARGGEVSTIGSGTVSWREARAEHRWDQVVEWAENSPRGLEHGFDLARPVIEREQSAPLRLELRLGGTLSATLLEDRSAAWLVDEHGVAVLKYSNLKVLDALERELPAHFEPCDSGLAIVIDDAGASYPITIDPLLTTATWNFYSGQGGASLGISVAVAGDVNRDGYSDLIVGADMFDGGELDEGRVFVFHGSAAGPSISPNWSAEINQPGAAFGRSVASAGDVNGDGFHDVIIGAPLYQSSSATPDEGAAFVWLGSAAGLGGPTSPAWRAEGDQANAEFGASVSGAGDFNGNGFDEVLIGAPRFTDGQTREGKVFAWLGSPTGLGPNGNPGNAFWKSQSDQPDADFGRSVAPAGDVNADGFDDVVIGSPLFNNPTTDEGRAFVWLGSATGPTPLGVPGNANWSAEGNEMAAQFGASVAGVGDVDGDGDAEILIGIPFADSGGSNEGRAQMYYGSVTGPSTTVSWSGESDQNDAHFGSAVAPAGDVNGDGFADVAVGAPDYEDSVATDGEGRSFIWYGSGSGPTASGHPGNEDWSVDGAQSGAHFGKSLSGAGDVDGDGFGDFVVGAPGHSNTFSGEGRAAAYRGSGAGLATTSSWNPGGGAVDAFLGTRVAAAGDLNGDGYGDVAIGAERFDGPGVDAGRVFVYQGSSNGLPLTATIVLQGAVANARFGASLARAGDVNGDGFSDLVVGASHYSNGQTEEGRLYVYRGSAAGLSATNYWFAELDQPFAHLGSSAAGGDLNRDGFGDVFAGAPQYDADVVNGGAAFGWQGSATGLPAIQGTVANADWFVASTQADSNFGAALTSVGDFDRDGFSDLAVGAPLEDSPEIDEGAVYVYRGKSRAPAREECWRGQINVAGAHFGEALAAAGDVDRDGFADLVIGAPQFSGVQPSEGKAFLYRGTVNGTPTTPAWSVESNQAQAHFGAAVGGGGDVNGDGFSDIVIGAPDYTAGLSGQGRVSVYHGSSSGPATTASRQLDGDQAGSRFGAAVAMAGDVNGDGFADLLVGAPDRTGSISKEGRASLFYGNGSDGIDGRTRQAITTGAAPIDVGGRSDSLTSFRLRMTGRSPAGRTRARLEWELKPFGQLFDGTGLTVGSTVDTGASGALLDELSAGMQEGKSYSWRARQLWRPPVFPQSRWTLPTFGSSAFVLLQAGCNDPDLGDASNELTMEGTALRWTAIPGANHYDVIRGSVSLMLQNVASGRTIFYSFYISCEACAAENVDQLATDDADVPAAGQAWYYLVRGQNCAGPGLYGSVDPDEAGGAEGKDGLNYRNHSCD